MKFSLIKIINLASIFMLLDITNSWDAIIMFVFIGMVPGTDIILTPDQMILLNSCLAVLIMLIVLIKPIIKLIKRINFKKIKMKFNLRRKKTKTT